MKMVCVPWYNQMKDRLQNYGTHGKKGKGMKKQQLTGPEPATSRPIPDPLAAETRSLPTSIDLFPS